MPDEIIKIEAYILNQSGASVESFESEIENSLYDMVIFVKAKSTKIKDFDSSILNNTGCPIEEFRKLFVENK